MKIVLAVEVISCFRRKPVSRNYANAFLPNNFKPTCVHSKTCFCWIDLATNLLSFHNFCILITLYQSH